MISHLKVKNLVAKINYTYDDTTKSIAVILNEEIDSKLKVELIGHIIAKCNSDVEVLKGN